MCTAAKARYAVGPAQQRVFAACRSDLIRSYRDEITGKDTTMVRETMRSAEEMGG